MKKDFGAVVTSDGLEMQARGFVELLEMGSCYSARIKFGVSGKVLALW